jgi:thiol:disulfide interchange protein DsbA
MSLSRTIVGGAVALAWVFCSMVHTGSMAQAATTWTEGKNYSLIKPPRPPQSAPGKVVVTEVFSYGCPACNAFVPTMHKLKQALPANAVLDYLPASFNPAEDWPMFQQAFLTAQVLGVADQTHDAMFYAVWATGELAIIDPTTQRIKSPLPSIEDAARFYQKKAGVPVATFLNTAKSFAVDTKTRAAEQTIAAYGVDRTPTIVVNGKYRVTTESASLGNPSANAGDQLIELVKWLVAKESQ